MFRWLAKPIPWIALALVFFVGREAMWWRDALFRCGTGSTEPVASAPKRGYTGLAVYNPLVAIWRAENENARLCNRLQRRRPQSCTLSMKVVARHSGLRVGCGGKI